MGTLHKMEGMEARLSARLDAIEGALAALTAQVAALADALAATQRACTHMDSHIQFVEGVYDSVRHPLTYLTTRFGGARALPEPPRGVDAPHTATHAGA